MEHFADNLERLLGLHKLSAKEAADMLGLSQSVLSKWQSGARQPSFSSALAAGDFFGVPADRLARADFSDLLAHELVEPDRFRAVEQRIAASRTGLRVVGPEDIPKGTKVTVTSGPLLEHSTSVPRRGKATKTRKRSS